MIKLFIADDEAIVRKGLQTSIEWSSYGISIVGEAKNGVEALKMCLELQPHILLTDIRMPVMDGLELSKQLSEKLPGIKIVILSGYNDFEYAKQAIHLNVVEYLLKPFGAEELVALMVRLKNKILIEEKKQEEVLKTQTIIEENRQLLQSKLIRSILKDSYDDYTYIREKAKLIQLNLNGPFYQIIVFNIDDQELIREKLKYKEMEYIKNSIFSIAEEILQENCNGTIFMSEFDYFVGLINLDKSDSINLTSVLEEIKVAVQKYVKVTITIGIGNIYFNLQYINKSYDEAIFALRQKIYRGKNSIIHANEIANLTEIIEPADYPINEEKQLIEALKAVDDASIKNVVAIIFEKLRQSLVSEDNLKNYCAKLALMSVHTLEVMGIDIKKQLGVELNLYTEIKKYETIYDLQQWLITLLEKFTQQLNMYKSQKYKQMVNMTLEYIEKHYNENITLKVLSETVYVTPNYLSRIFKEETGENFIEWLNRFRIEKAKIFLKETMLKTYEIAEKVGYSDYKYFSYNFKKYTGISPRQYSNNN